LWKCKFFAGSDFNFVGQFDEIVFHLAKNPSRTRRAIVAFTVSKFNGSYKDWRHSQAGLW